MSLLAATALSKAYGAQDVFRGVSLAIPHQARVALVGPNGVGKTTLLRVLAGLERADAGRVQRARNLRIGYLPQHQHDLAGTALDGRHTLRSLCERSFDTLRAQEAELARLEAAMAEPARAEQALARYGPLQEAFERAGGYTYPARIRQVLQGLGFASDEHDRPLAQLSGGERTRAYLAHLLLDDPDLLLLDEPTNHLDIAAVEWLEGWLRDWPGAALTVSHDRRFLDRTVEAVWELAADRLETYRGDYTAYAGQRAARRRDRQAAHQAQQEHVAREQEYIRRNLAGQNTRQAQGRRTRLERLLRDQAVEAPQRERGVRMAFTPAGRSGEQVLVTQALAVGYPEAPEPLVRLPDLTLRRGECAALIGPNGAGKTTLLKTLLGELPPWSGEARLGASLHIGYLAQAQDGLNPEWSVLQALQEADPGLGPQPARSLLGRFLFPGETVDKLVAMLSGGERARLALARLMVAGANLLLLDEPTTHLDLPSQEVLQQALQEYAGTVLLVSHDRYLIDALATQVWAIEPDGGSLRVFEGGYSAYADEFRRAREAAAPGSRDVGAAHRRA